MLTTQLIHIVKDCCELFVEGYYCDKDIHFKGTVDLVTEYDIAIEKRLTEALSEAFPDYTVIGEESTKEITHPNKAIYIDPIDGTTNFVHGLPFCAISVGMWKNGEPLAGVVYNPILEECFSAEKGKGAFLNGEAIHVSSQNNFQQSLVATGFPYTKVEKGKDYEWVLKTMANMLPITRDVRRYGSAAIDLCYTACGKLDAYYECNLKPWDVAAGILILLEAGGEISDEKGDLYTLDSHIIAASNSLIHQNLVENIG